ncbi:hypothetical protein B296_00029805 [Ensete ventricosum]|uniref:CDP-diacylglycerol--serine O-phosphatidyltransferase n=1 Tax=Ensete ventricosum TaxID=4639 RepID=A0A426XM79_ENSVE|nr:hypothetical protein B296_00029805 [Ensete ventricosum]
MLYCCFYSWASGVVDPESTASNDVVTSVKSLFCFLRGVWAVIAVYLAYSLLQAPSTLIDKAVTIAVQLVMTILISNLLIFVRVLIRPHPAIWRMVHGMAVVYLVALTFLLFQETLFDEFVPAHIFGWWGKAIMIRNQPLLWVLSIGFEAMEVCFQILQLYQYIFSRSQHFLKTMSLNGRSLPFAICCQILMSAGGTVLFWTSLSAIGLVRS